jgi:hypothetical protein
MMGTKRLKSLDALLNDINQSSETRLTAQSSRKKMDELETTLTLFWNDILIRINSVSKALQKQNMNLLVVFKLIKSLMAYLSEKTDCFDEYESERGKNLILMTTEMRIGKRVRQCSSTVVLLGGGRNTDELFQGSREFKVETYIPMMDSPVNNSEKRSKEYEEIFDKFGFLESLHVLDQCGITKQCENLLISTTKISAVRN